MSKTAGPRSAPRSLAKHERIVEAAVQAFASKGYQGVRVDDLAADLGIAKGSIFQHFGSKAGLFFAAYRKAVESLPAWLDAPSKVARGGFWTILVYWLERTEHLMNEDRIPYRVVLVGNYGTDLALRRQILHYLVSEDPYGTLEFIEFGLERGDLRQDLDVEMTASMLDWLAGGFQDALATKDLDPGLVHRHADVNERRAIRIEQFVDLLRHAIGADGSSS